MAYKANSESHILTPSAQIYSHGRLQVVEVAKQQTDRKGKNMAFLRRMLTACLVSGAVSFSIWPAAAWAGEALGGPSPLSGNPLVVSSEEPLVGDQQAAAAEAARVSPEAKRLREASAMDYQNLDAGTAEALTGETFSSLIHESPSGPPSLPAGQRITGYVDPYSADISLGGERGLVESTQPMAFETAPGSWSPVDLGLRKVGNVIEPTSPLVNVQASKRLSEGVQLPGPGIKVTPVDSQQPPLGGTEGVVDGKVVFFANTQTDTDTIFKPSAFGFAIDTVLRSAKSPDTLSFRVDLPPDARLVAIKDGSAAASIVREGAAIATVPAPVARDAAGVMVPVTTTVAGNVLTLKIARHAGEQLYPIVVDPEFNTVTERLTLGNWHHSEAAGGKFEFETLSELRVLHQGSFPLSNWAYFASQTKGDSKIYEAATFDTLEPAGYNGNENSTYPYYRVWGEIFKEGVEHTEKVWSGEAYRKEPVSVCPQFSCPPSGGAPENIVRFEITSVESSAEAIGKGIISEPTYYGAQFTNTETYISQPKETHSTVEYNTKTKEVEYTSGGKVVKTPNAFYGNGWIGPSSGAFEFESKDAGLGVAGANIEIYKVSKWEVVHSKNYLAEGVGCLGVQCNSMEHEVATYAMLSTHLVNGPNKIRVAAHDPMENTWSSEHGEGEQTLNVDTEAPHEIKISGLSAKGETYELGESEVHLTATAADGEGTVSSSGIKSLGLEVDGKALGNPAGECLSAGPCTASAAWSINGAELGTGQHTLTVVATDKAGNVATKNFTLLVYHASPVAMGPGSVNPESGDFAMEATDVYLSGGMGPLTLTRHYDSRNLTEGREGPFGPQWSISLGSLASLEVLPDGSVMVVGPEGLTHFSQTSGGGFEAPVGDSSLVLASKSKEYVLENKTKGTTTVFTLPSGAKSWLPTTSTGSIATDTMTDEYETAEPEAGQKIVQPKFELAPHPPATCVRGNLAAGCRALEFVYGAETKAKGENQTEWGDYKGRLKEVLFAWYNATKKLTEGVAVAQYEYDKLGRLRAEWDPRISPSLRTVYGYDSEGHVTAVTRPGKETLTATYGTIAGDPTTGRFLKGTQAPASAKLWNGELPKDIEVPKLSGTPSVNVVMGASNGTWANEPDTFSYQWEDCNSEGKACTTILGATNANYTVSRSDVGHTLVAQVTATNGGGSVAVVTATSGVVVTGITEYTIGPEKDPTGITAGPDGNLWFTNSFGVDINKMTTTGEITRYSLSSGNDSYRIATGPDKNLWFTNPNQSRIGRITTTGTITEFALPPNCFPRGITTGPDKNLWFTEYNCSKIGKITTSGTVTEYSLPAGSQPAAITSGTDGNLWFADHGVNKVGKITPSGTITEYSLPSGSASNDITTGPESKLWFTNGGNSKIGKISTSGVVTEYAIPSGSGPTGITYGPDGNIWFTDNGAGKISRMTASGSVVEYTLPSGSHPAGIITGSDGNVWFTEEGTDEIGKVALNVTEGQHYTPGPGTTVEYRVPLSGTGLQGMTVSGVEKWGQKDDPIEATAIYPPDEPQGWPATDYKRATVLYFDAEARTVNVASPAGAVSTTEYGPDNTVERTLSAANRATALKEANPAESAKLLDTESEYTDEGTELVERTGPQHLVRIAGGSEVQARSHVKYFYDEGAPEGEEPGLVTRTIESALVSGKEEEPRTARTYYSGQNGLGWKLRKPTSLVTDPAGLDLVHTIVYNEATGNVVEARNPGGNAEKIYPPSYAGTFGSEGAGKGQFNHPEAVAIDSSGNVWVDDKNNDRIEKLSPTGTFLAEYGAEGSGNSQFSNAWGLAIAQTTGNVYVADTGNNRMEELNSSGAFVRTFGTEGSGRLKEPDGVTVDSSGDVWVSDYGDDRVVEFSSTGVFMKEVGKGGTGNGEFKGPEGMTISEGSLYVVDNGNDRVEQFSFAGAYLNEFGSEGTAPGQLKGPIGIAANPTSGDLYVTDWQEQRVQEFSPAGRFLTQWETWSKSHPISNPIGIAIARSGELYISDQYANEISRWVLPEAGGAMLRYASQFGSYGSGEGQFHKPFGAAIDGHGNIWVTDQAQGRVEEFSSAGKFIAAYGSEGAGNAQFSSPCGIDINQSTGNVYVADWGNKRIEELSSTGTFVRTFGTSGTGALNGPNGLTIDSSGNVWVADENNNRIVEFSSTGTFISAYGSGGTGNGQFEGPTDIVFSGSNLYVTDLRNDRVEELSTTGSYIRQFGIEGSNSGEFYGPSSIAADPSGNLYVADVGNSRVEEFSATGGYVASFASEGAGEGQIKEPMGVAINAAGAMYIIDTVNARVAQWVPTDQAVHDTRTIYYTAKSEAGIPACENHAEWVELVCETLPAAQPEASELPALPVTTVRYNVWDEPEVITETFGSVSRTKTTSFDPAGRPVTTEIASTNDTPVAAVTDKYDSKTGALIEESTTVAGKTRSITSAVNTVGQLESYTDADGSKTTYKRDVDGRVTEVSNVIEAGGTKEATYQKYVYDETAGFMTKLEDSAAGTFTANRDAVGRIVSETYPNAMTATNTYNSVGATTGIRYEKTAHCASTCPETWFKETTVPSTHGEVLERVNSLTTDIYAYDPDGRLVQVQERPIGKGCVTRLYAYDEESNRTSLTSRPAGTEGKCASEGGTTETHKYDPANRLTDNGVSYEAFGNTTTLPGVDAGGPEMEIQTEYYADNQVAAQTQDGVTDKYYMDPAGRVRETKREVEHKIVAEVTSHYSGPGPALAWSSEEAGKKWTRDIPGIDGSLAAIQPKGGLVTLQLHNLQGDVVDTAADSELETKVLSSYNSTEFGVPLNGPPPTRYSWLGAIGVTSEQTSGLVTQDGITYVPETGRPLQTQGVAPPTPDNNARLYFSTIEPGIDASAAAASVNQVVNAQQAKQALEESERPVSEEPEPEEPEEPEPEEPEPEGPPGRAGIGAGEEFGSGGCTGGGACASAHYHCEVHVLFGEPVGLFLVAGGDYKCNFVTEFQIEVCILAPTKLGGQQFGSVECNEENGKKGEIRRNKSSGNALTAVGCAEGVDYEAWVWGYAFDVNYGFASHGKKTGEYLCEGTGSAEFYSELGDFLTKG